MKTVQINLYSLSELSKNSKNVAIQEHKDFLKLVGEPYNTRATIESIEINEYLFFSSGKLTSTVFYCGEHPRKGEHIFTLEGQEYPIV